MVQWKKIVAAILAGLIVLSTVGCGKKSAEENTAIGLVEEEIYENATSPTSATVEDVMNATAWGMDISIPVDWSAPGAKSRNDAFRLNGFYFLDKVYVEYKETGDTSYAELIIDYMVDWATQNTEAVLDEDDNWPWNDDATGRRMLRMSLYYAVFKDTLMTDEEEAVVEASMQLQAETLCLEEFYKEKHNHGMHQDMGLIAYAILVHPEKEAEYVALAVSRTQEYLDYVFTSDGIHKEHSPMYAVGTLDDLVLVQNLTAEAAPEFSENTSEILEKTEAYLVQYTMPDGSWPSVGDSVSREILSLSDLENNDLVRWIADHDTGTKPETDVVYEEGGYAFFRSDWEDTAEEGTWMMMVAATFSSTHKHGDDLEVLLYHKGELFVEGGKRDYNYLTEQTAWAYSGYAHNVLLVNGEAYPVKVAANGYQAITKAAKDTGITDYEITGTVNTVTGTEHRFEGINQDRTLTYNKEQGIVVVQDVITAEEAFDGCLLWHIAEGVEVQETAEGWSFFRNGVVIAEMRVEADCDLYLETITGEGEYPYCTWIFGEGSSEPTYGSLLKVNFDGHAEANTITATINLK